MRSAAARVAEHVSALGECSWFRAPGRVNLIGEHTDYNEGFVLPLAIDRDCVIAARRAETVRLTSLDLGESIEVPTTGGREEERSPAWGRLAAAVLRELAALGRPAVGMEAVLASDVPIGAGLSSSASFEIACALALADVAGWECDRNALALACRDAEERATGVPCGVMDQLAVLGARESCALLIDCRTLELASVRLPERLEVLVVHSGQERTLAASAYGARRRACEALARELGVAALRDASMDQVADNPLGRHVVTENARVLEAVRALEQGDLETLGALMIASHASLRDDYRVSTPELDALVEALVASGALGARLTGGGFGGAVVAVCRRGTAEAVGEAAAARYRVETGLEPRLYRCRPVDGAGALRLPL